MSTKWIKLTDLDENGDLGLYEVPEELVGKLDEILWGSDIGWELVEKPELLDEAGLRAKFNIPVCEHERDGGRTTDPHVKAFAENCCWKCGWRMS